MEMLSKYSKQWSTYRGLVLAAGAALGLTEVAVIYEGVNQLLLGATAIIGAWEVSRDDEKEKEQ